MYMYEAIEWKLGKKGQQCWELNPGQLVLAASALPLSYNRLTSSTPFHTLLILRRWYWHAPVVIPGSHPHALSEILSGLTGNIAGL